MRKEDNSMNCSNFLDVLRNTLERELFEELGVSISIDKNQTPFVIYTPNSEKSKKHLAIGWKIPIDEDTKFRLDSYELVQKKGKTKSGSFISLDEITGSDMSFESWSKTILLELFSESLTDFQKEFLKEQSVEQLDML